MKIGAVLAAENAMTESRLHSGGDAPWPLDVLVKLLNAQPDARLTIIRAWANHGGMSGVRTDGG